MKKPAAPKPGSRDTSAQERAATQREFPGGSGDAPRDIPRPSTALTVALCVALCLVTAAIYAQTCRFGFIAYDDDTYVYENAMVKRGLTLSGVAWAFTAYCCANWHPLTMLSLMLDCQLFGANAGAHHAVNLIFHLASTALLFIAFVRMTRRPWRSAVVAGIFALHPLHVESVAWIAERKDVLSTFFAALTLLFYVRYAETPTARRSVAVAVLFGLGLMAKSMLVTLPFVLLLLDIWPLRRFRWPPSWRELGRLVGEKAPLIAMSAAVSVVTVFAQRSEGAVSDLAKLPFPERLSSAAVAYVEYIGKAFWPVKLAVLYPYQDYSAAIAIGAVAILAIATIGALTLARKRPYVLVGWLWYLGMLVPVIGLVQVGAQSMADRYTYLALVGLSFAIVWLIADLAGGRLFFTCGAAVIGCVALLLLGAQAYRQTGYWESSRTLFEHALAVTQRNHIIHNNLGVILGREGKHDEAVAHYLEALSYRPDYAEAHANLGHELMRLGRFGEAYSHLADALRMKPTLADAHADLGTLLAAQLEFDEARMHLEESLRLAPDKPDVRSNLGFVLLRLGRVDESIAQCNEALRLKPEAVDAHYNLGMALAAAGKKREAAAEFTKALQLNPNHTASRNALAELGK